MNDYLNAGLLPNAWLQVVLGKYCLDEAEQEGIGYPESECGICKHLCFFLMLCAAGSREMFVATFSCNFVCLILFIIVPFLLLIYCK